MITFNLEVFMSHWISGHDLRVDNQKSNTWEEPFGIKTDSSVASMVCWVHNKLNVEGIISRPIVSFSHWRGWRHCV